MLPRPHAPVPAGLLAIALQLAPAAAQPLAYLFDHEDKWTHSAHAADLLRAAGFRVEPLPLDRPPIELDSEVILLGSFVSEDPRYAAYMARHARGLFDYVDKGHVLVQLAQADQTEPVPPFLPSTSSRGFPSTNSMAMKVVFLSSMPKSKTETILGC